jgi:hypothetical protein
VPAGHQQIPHITAFAEQTLHLADDVHDVRVALDHHQVAHRHAARPADATEVVAAQVDQHHVLGPLLGIGEQFGLQGLVLHLIPAAGSGAGDRPHRGPHRAVLQWFGLDHHLRAGADQVPVAEVEEGHVGGGVDHPQAAVEVEGIALDAGLKPLAQHQLEHITGLDVGLAAAYRVLELLPFDVAADRQVVHHLIGGGVVPAQRRHRTGQGLLHARLQGGDAASGMVPGMFGIDRLPA